MYKRQRFNNGEIDIIGEAPRVDDPVAYAPRRYALDGVLADAATAAGAELRDQCDVTELLSEGDRINGVRYTNNGQEHSIQARFVIGADGAGSKVARLTQAQTLMEHDNVQGTLWSYFEDLPVNDLEFFAREGSLSFAWRTNDHQTCFGTSFRYENFAEVNQAREESVFQELDKQVPELAERVRAANRTCEWHAGTTKGFARKAFGPGWALVGDAGITIDPITAAGISNALRDAEHLADALIKCFVQEQDEQDALTEYEALRDEHTLPMYGFAQQMGMLNPSTEEERQLFLAISRNQQAIDDYFGVFAQSVPIGEFFADENLSAIVSE